MRSLVLAAMCCVGVARSSLAQEPGTTPPQTRAEAIGAERAEKIAELWPERQNAMVDLVNGFAGRGTEGRARLGQGLERRAVHARRNARGPGHELRHRLPAVRLLT